MSTIKILNREDHRTGKMLGDAEVYVDDHLCGTITSVTIGGKWYTVQCDVDGEGVKGSFVKVVARQGASELHICGIQVFGY